MDEFLRRPDGSIYGVRNNTPKAWNPLTGRWRTITVDGIAYRAEPKFGGWYEVDDPTPSGSIGRTMLPMNRDGSPDLENLVVIEVAYEDA